MTNYKRIRKMTVEEMAELLVNTKEYYCQSFRGVCAHRKDGKGCKECAKEWLNSDDFKRYDLYFD